MVLTFMPSSIYAAWLIYSCSGNHYVYINFNFLSFVCSLYHLSKTKFSLWILVLNQLPADGGTGELTSSDFSMWPWQYASTSVWTQLRSSSSGTVFLPDQASSHGSWWFWAIVFWDLAKTFLLNWRWTYLLYQKSFSCFCFPFKYPQLVNWMNVVVDFT